MATFAVGTKSPARTPSTSVLWPPELAPPPDMPGIGADPTAAPACSEPSSVGAMAAMPMPPTAAPPRARNASRRERRPLMACSLVSSTVESEASTGAVGDCRTVAARTTRPPSTWAIRWRRPMLSALTALTSAWISFILRGPFLQCQPTGFHAVIGHAGLPRTWERTAEGNEVVVRATLIPPMVPEETLQPRLDEKEEDYG